MTQELKNLPSTPPPYFWQRRRFYVWSFVLFIVAVIVFVACLPTTRALVQFQRVRKGDDLENVLALLGPPTARTIIHTREGKSTGSVFLIWHIGELSLVVELLDDVVSNKRMNTDLTIARRFFPDLFRRNLL